MKRNQVLDEKVEKRDINWFISAFFNLRQESQSKEFSRLRSHPIAIYAHDYIGIQINSYGVYEHEQLNHLFTYIKKLDEKLTNSTVIDIGANIGNHSLYFSEIFNKVVAFEPNPNTYELLQFNTRSKTNVSTFCLGLGDEIGTFHLTLTPTNLGSCYISEEPDDVLNHIPVSVDRLDNIMDNSEKIGLIKIDAEGFEEKIINGGYKIIKKHRPIIVFEQLEREIENGSSPVISQIRQLGYKVLWRQASMTSNNWLIKRLINAHNFFFGKKFCIVSGDSVPKMDHSLLLAIPESIVDL